MENWGKKFKNRRKTNPTPPLQTETEEFVASLRQVRYHQDFSEPSSVCPRE